MSPGELFEPFLGPFGQRLMPDNPSLIRRVEDPVETVKHIALADFEAPNIQRLILPVHGRGNSLEG